MVFGTLTSVLCRDCVPISVGSQSEGLENSGESVIIIFRVTVGNVRNALQCNFPLHVYVPCYGLSTHTLHCGYMYL